MALKRVNFADIITFTRATEKTGFQLVPDGFGGTKIELQTFASGVPAVPVYDPATGQPLGLSVHEQRTNLITSSNLSLGGAVGVTRSTVNSIISGESATELTSSGVTNASISIPVTVASTASTVSTIVESVPTGDRQICEVLIGGVRFTINYDAEVINVITGTEVKFFKLSNSGLNGGKVFYAEVTGTFTTGSQTGYFYPTARSGTGATVVHHIQLESGSFATPPIITNGLSATRNTDVPVIQNLDTLPFWNPSEGEIKLKFKYDAVRTVATVFEITDGTSNNRIGAFIYESPPRIETRYASGGTSAPTATVSLTEAELTQELEMTVKYSASGITLEVTGKTPSSSVASAAPIGLNTWRFGALVSGSLPSNMYFKEAIYTPNAGA